MGRKASKHACFEGASLTSYDASTHIGGRSPVGTIAQLALAQRQIRVSRAHIPLNRHHRKRIPKVVKTTGDYIQAKRYEKGLNPYQVAGKLGVGAALIAAWERGDSEPDLKQWQMLSDLLSFDSGIDLPKPHR
jgi:ribosome-binding protein aMBF1 (putative translation factor)